MGHGIPSLERGIIENNHSSMGRLYFFKVLFIYFFFLRPLLLHSSVSSEGSLDVKGLNNRVYICGGRCVCMSKFISLVVGIINIGFLSGNLDWDWYNDILLRDDPLELRIIIILLSNEKIIYILEFFFFFFLLYYIFQEILWRYVNRVYLWKEKDVL